MKKILFIVALFATTLSQTSFAQNTTTQTSPTLSLYYNIKDALVTGNTNLAASKAEELKKVLSNTEQGSLSIANRNSLTKEANLISSAKDIKAQRAAFTDLSATMLNIAKTEKLSMQPVYQLYCPMKKSYWLSSEKGVKNPYYGSSMLTCGKVEGTL